MYTGLIKVYTNQTNVLEGSTAVVEHKDKEQAVGCWRGSWNRVKTRLVSKKLKNGPSESFSLEIGM